MYIPNEDKPGELSTLHEGIGKLMECQVQGKWDLGKLDSWLKQHPDRMKEAVEVLDSVLDEHYPPKVS